MAFVPSSSLSTTTILPQTLQRTSTCRIRPTRATPTRRRVAIRSSATQANPRTSRRPGEKKGFVFEMRMVAMRLHTKDQAPREGEMEASALPIEAWMPSKSNFMQFLVDSKCVYEYFENELIQHEMFERFRKTGLERIESLEKDIAYLNTLGVETLQPTPYAAKYVEYMKSLLGKKPESVLCHWYNYYFAHSAGGRMIGRLMQDRLFDGRQFAFYEWESDVKELLDRVREVIDDVSAAWSRDLKDECLKETGLAFGYSGTILQNLAKAES